ncbi:hypothetical protein [Fibrobacter sp. UWB10]|uniref:hypothetical protein n=1 Tax=Fibrobacter sp. UWB10 TaxID=1896201 RepID=UPI0024B6B9E8|nr:hypothetical protein [Fibrobacter sp. UWB10]
MTREQSQKFSHARWFCKSKAEIAIMNEVALAIFYGIDNDIEFMGNIANFNIFFFRH